MHDLLNIVFQSGAYTTTKILFGQKKFFRFVFADMRIGLVLFLLLL